MLLRPMLNSRRYVAAPIEAGHSAMKHGRPRDPKTQSGNHQATPTKAENQWKRFLPPFSSPYLLGGDDHYNGGSDGGSDGGADIPMSQFVFGGDGNDKIQGGTGNDVLIGGTGDDDLKGGSGRDILLGSLGSDQLKGNTGDDILIGGSAANQDYLQALDQALADWVSGNLNATLFHLGSLFDDNRRDDLSGDQGTDYLYGGVGDKVKQ